MTNLTREFLVNVPLQRAWDHLARVEVWPSWAKHIKSVTLEPPGALSPCTVGVFHLTNGMHARFAMSEFLPPRSWKWIGKFLWFTIHYDHRFTPINDQQTKITFIIEVEGFGKSVFGKLFLAIYRKHLDRAIPNLIAEMNASLDDAKPH
jgi:hypothetical protein